MGTEPLTHDCSRTPGATRPAESALLRIRAQPTIMHSLQNMPGTVATGTAWSASPRKGAPEAEYAFSPDGAPTTRRLGVGAPPA